MRRINTKEELKAERKRLQSRKVLLEAEIKMEFRQIKQSLEPIRILAKTAERTLISENNHLMSNSAGLVARFITKASLRRSGYLSRLVVPYLVKNVTSNFVENNKDKILSWVEVIFSRLASKKPVKELEEQH